MAQTYPADEKSKCKTGPSQEGPVFAVNVTLLYRHKAYTGLLNGDFWGRRQALQRSRQDQMEFFLHLFYNSLNTA